MGLLSEVQAGLAARMQPVFGAAGLSEIDFETLLRLGRSPRESLRMSDLAAQTGLSTSGVTRVVDRLERDGLVARVACAPTAGPRTPRSPTRGGKSSKSCCLGTSRTSTSA